MLLSETLSNILTVDLTTYKSHVFQIYYGIDKFSTVHPNLFNQFQPKADLIDSAKP